MGRFLGVGGAKGERGNYAAPAREMVEGWLESAIFVANTG